MFHVLRPVSLLSTSSDFIFRKVLFHSLVLLADIWPYNAITESVFISKWWVLKEKC